MRIHTSSAGMDAQRLEPGADLVLAIEDAQGDDLAEGVLAHDHLDHEARERVDSETLAAIARWRALHDETLTVDGVCLPWMWELPLLIAFNPVVRDAAGLSRAVAKYGPDRLVLADRDARTAAVARAVADARGIPLEQAPEADDASRIEAAARPQPLSRRARRAALGAATRFGFPSRLRDGSVVVLAYWPLEPLLDRMMADRALRPAVSLRKLPAGPRRALKAARRGGWLGLPTPLDARRAQAAAAPALEAAAAVPSLPVLGMELGPALHAQAIAIARARAVDDLAYAAAVRRAFRSRRPRRVVGTYDVEPLCRIVITLAQEAGIPTLVLAHGAFLMPQVLADMDVSDEIALWSRAVAPPITRWDRPVHMVGYPLPHESPPTRARDPQGGRPRVLVLPQSWVPHTSTIDPRTTMRHCLAAAGALRRVLPGAQVVLRPHPSHDPRTVEALGERFAGLELEVDRTTEMLELLRSCDICIGTTSTATLQAALVGTPVVALNVTGFDWVWPLGGDTAVPVARNEGDLAAALERWASGELLPGRDDLLGALGAGHGDDGVERLLSAVIAPPPAAHERPEPVASGSR